MSQPANKFKDEVIWHSILYGNIMADNQGNLYRPDNITIPVGSETQKGYIVTGLRYQGKNYTVYSHRVVWMFHNDRIPDGYEINHKNGIKTNNNINNLELMTAKENMAHSRDVLGNTHNGNAKLTETEVLEIRKLYAAGGTSHQKLAEEFDMSNGCIWAVINRKTWKHI